MTNEQRKSFALAPVDEKWMRIEAKQSPYDDFKTFLYLDGENVVKGIHIGEKRYCECDLSEKISADGKYLLPKTSKGKLVLLSSSTIQKRKPVGMWLSYHKDLICLYDATTERTYYSNFYSCKKPSDLSDFIGWVEEWCNETTAKDQIDILRFTQEKRKHVRYKEGDVFRFKITRRLYRYGRILLDYDKMRKRGEPFWISLWVSHLFVAYITSSQPYWNLSYSYNVERDLRNPEFSDKLLEIQQQMNI